VDFNRQQTTVTTVADQYDQKALLEAREGGLRGQDGEGGRRVMRLERGPVAWGLAWFAGVLGLLWLGSLPGDLGHALFGDALCGPWG
jgi:hypothetical protein